MTNIEKVKCEVKQLLCTDNSGHGFEHTERVLRLSLAFAEKEKADMEKVHLIALLHDVDDYKLIGSEKAEELYNAKKIMHNCGVDGKIQNEVMQAIKTIGYSKRLKGIVPETIEAKIVSDADMCDALGVNGFLRTYQFGMSRGRPFFNRAVFPRERLSAETYTNKDDGTGIGHIFEKILKLKNLMLTSSGKNEAVKRHEIVLKMLYSFFREENAPEWIEYLDKFSENLNSHF